MDSAEKAMTLEQVSRGLRKWADCNYVWSEDAADYADAIDAHLAARAKPQAESQDAKDAARYRWLKRHCVSTWHQVDGVALVVPTPGGTESVDMDVDIAMEESAHD